MSRIRTVKPEFWCHPKVTAVSRDARLMFLGLLNEADDEGRLRYIPKRLAGVVFPEDDDVDGAQVDRWCDELEAIGLVCRYDVDGARLLALVGFGEHQVINRPTASRLPAPLTEPSVNGHGALTEPSVGEGKGREGKGRDIPPDGGSKPRKKAAHPLPDGWIPSEATREWAKAEYPEQAKRSVVAAFTDHARANDRRQVDWDSAFRNWVRNEAKWSAGKPGPARTFL